MPKRKPDRVIRHEIALAKPERDALDLFTMGYSFNKVTTPFVNLLSTPYGIAAGIGLAELFGFIDIRAALAKTPLQDSYDGLMAGIYATQEAAEKAKDEILDLWREEIKPDLEAGLDVLGEIDEKGITGYVAAESAAKIASWAHFNSIPYNEKRNLNDPSSLYAAGPQSYSSRDELYGL